MDTLVISKFDELEALAVDWRALWMADEKATYFQSPDWLLPWWRHFGSGELFVVASRSGPELRALLPMLVLRDEDESLGIFIGTGHSDYLNVIATDAAALPPVIEALAAHDCQLWDLQQLPPDSMLVTVGAAPFTDHVEDHDICPRLDLRSQADRSSAHSRKKLRYLERALATAGSIEWIDADTSNLDALLDGLFTLHAARWKRRDLPGVLDDSATQSFHREVARRALASGVLRMYALSLDGRLIGVWYGFAAKGTTSFYLSGFDPACEKLSIGSQLIARAMDAAIREGATTFDFLRGAEEYKHAWGAIDRTNRRRQFIRT